MISMNIVVNGNKQEVTGSMNLLEAIRRFARNEKGIIVQLNDSLVKKQDWETHVLKDGDRLEMMQLVGGG